METGKSRNPSTEILIKISNHFNVTIGWLVGEDETSTDDENLKVLFRTLQGLHPDDVDLIKTMAQQLENRRSELRICLLMDLADESRPKDIAKSILKMLREQFEGRLPIPIPIEEIAILLEINNIIYQEFKSIDGMLLVNEDIGQIFVNSTLSNHCQRYTIGHELQGIG